MNAVVQIDDMRPIADIVSTAISQVRNGEVDPIVAHVNISRMEKAIKMYKSDDEVRDITLRELSKYGKRMTYSNIVLEECESGVTYDYSQCGDEKLMEMYEMRKALDADIKAREKMLQTLPDGGMADPDTGVILYRPARSSKTVIKTTFKK